MVEAEKRIKLHLLELSLTPLGAPLSFIGFVQGFWKMRSYIGRIVGVAVRFDHSIFGNKVF
jgi:hypothetical protein